MPVAVWGSKVGQQYERGADDNAAADAEQSGEHAGGESDSDEENHVLSARG